APAGMRHPHAVDADTIDANDEGLVLDGAGLQQLTPGVRAGCRPVGDIDEHVVIQLRAPAAEYGESEVIADQRTHPQAAPFERPRRAARCEVLIFAPHPEQMALVVRTQLAAGNGPQQPVEVVPALLRDDASGDHRIEAVGERADPMGCRATCRLTYPLHVHAEAG